MKKELDAFAAGYYGKFKARTVPRPRPLCVATEAATGTHIALVLLGTPTEHAMLAPWRGALRGEPAALAWHGKHTDGEGCTSGQKRLQQISVRCAGGSRRPCAGISLQSCEHVHVGKLPHNASIV